MLFSKEVHVSLFSFQQIGSACSHRCSYLVKSSLSLVFRTCGFLCLEYPFPSIPALAVSPLILQLSVYCNWGRSLLGALTHWLTLVEHNKEESPVVDCITVSTLPCKRIITSSTTALSPAVLTLPHWYWAWPCDIWDFIASHTGKNQTSKTEQNTSE